MGNRNRHRIGAVAAAVAAATLVGACALEPIDLEKERPLSQRSTIHAADGTLLARLYRENRVLAPIESMPDTLIDAVLAAEDQRFFEHPGYDLRAITRAALANLKEGETVQGGSTITQQYVKNTYFENPPQTLERKGRELRLAIEVERRYSKRAILERYLNTVYLSEGAYGVKAAAQVYFGHGLGKLSLRESALLAAIIRSPSAYDPRLHPRLARARRDWVLERMTATGAVDAAHAEAALRRPLGVLPNPPQSATRQPYFVEAVKREVLADRRLGATDQARARALYKGGLRIDTTLERDLQRAAVAAVDSILNQPGDPEAALVAIRPETGEIVAMVGGRDWKASQVNLALGTAGGGSGRQPGSAMKPIALAAALEAQYSLDDTFESSPVVFTFDDGSTWDVGNAEGSGYGLLTLREALVHSVNGVFARLAVELGGGSIASMARLMGVSSKLNPYPSIVLGATEVSVLDMATAYATLANSGTAIEPTTIEAVHLPTGETLHPEQERNERVVAPGNAYLITKAMEEVIQRGTGRAADIGRPAAGKTGTTNDFGDAWFVGFTPDLVAAVWVGYPKGRIPMTNVHGSPVYGGTLPAQIWRAFMLSALNEVPPHDFALPLADVVIVQIDPASGLLVAPWCPGGKTKRMLRQLAPTEYCPQPAPEPAPEPTPEPSPSPSPTGGGDGGGEPKPTPSPSPSESPQPQPSPRPTGPRD